MFRRILLLAIMLLVLEACQPQHGDDLAQLASRYGEEALQLAQRHGDEGVSILGRYGEDGVFILQRYGEEGVSVVRQHGDEGVSIVRQYGDDGMSILKTYGDDGVSIVRRHGDDGVQILLTKFNIDGESQRIANEVEQLSGELSPNVRREVDLIITAAICDTLQSMAFGERIPTEEDAREFLAKHTLSRRLDWAGAPDWAPDVLSAALKVWQAAESGAPVDWNRERQKEQFGNACSQALN